jgi:hypothetical protein
MNTLRMIGTLAAIMWVLTTAAQPKKERIESMRIAYLSERLQLTPDEAKAFWPVYNKLEAEMKELRKKYRMMDEEEEIETMSEEEAGKKLNELLAFKEAQLNLAKKYQTELKKVIPARKVLLLYRAEEDFKRELLKRIRERRGAASPR